MRNSTDGSDAARVYRRAMEYAHFAAVVLAARHVRLRLSCFTLATLRRLAHWVRTVGTRPPPIDRITDEVERALAGERPDSPYHRYRYRG